MYKNICFIPARDSSTRLKNKNVSLFKKGNLITHTIEQAKICGVFDRIILSSNNKDILKIGKECGIEIHFREDKYDQIIDVIRQSIIDLDINKEDTIGLLLVTCPLRQIEDIQNAYRIFEENDKYNCVVSVKQNENPIQMSWKIRNDKFLEPIFPKDYYRSTRKQDHYKTYCYNDAIIFDSGENFMDPKRNLFGFSPIFYLMPWERSIAIDYEFQLKITQLLGEKNAKI